jgi:hypothetical protein
MSCRDRLTQCRSVRWPTSATVLALSVVFLFGLTPLQAAETQPIIIKFRTAPDILDDTAAADAAKREERSRFKNDLTRLTRARHDFRRAFNGQAIDVAPEAIEDIRTRIQWFAAQAWRGTI